ncbi:ParB/RepB/Spo0J family partition protein [Bacteroides thetaiotaomicron]|nr:ParB/RepB/Spo0J family partition protein [Bacteroides thetaiotaomicron]
MKTKANQSAAEKNITMVALADIQPSGFNPRKRFDEATLYELAESIKRQGVLQPITVRPVDGTDRYGIVFGERRYRASVIAGRDEIPAIVTELSDEEAEEMAITENLQRKDVTPVEEAADLSTAYRERTPHRADLGATLRKERELHPHTAEIHRPYPRNRRPFGSGRADHQRGG